MIGINLRLFDGSSPQEQMTNIQALWVIKSAPGIIPVWVQPTGAHDAYAIGDKVQWPEGGSVWESTIAANTTEPGTLLEHGYWILVD